ncbi:conserved hypothetical protein [Frankia sp. AiPs1]|uniref:hypothetical protein n=1 Tax=Frankia sp. AiPa1 TaxID=573492 RepID=UPI00202AD57F|nr:hypothetical protein [Frankia sp. AiPa1]MCL9758401.1 hypothetical protein [Frankia sp. AiPa1]
MWFLLIPPVALLMALVWVALRSRPDRSSEAMITIAGYRRSMAALARPIPLQPSSGDRSAPGVGPYRGDLDDHDRDDDPDVRASIDIYDVDGWYDVDTPFDVDGSDAGRSNIDSAGIDPAEIEPFVLESVDVDFDVDDTYLLTSSATGPIVLDDPQGLGRTRPRSDGSE